MRNLLFLIASPTQQYMTCFLELKKRSQHVHSLMSAKVQYKKYPTFTSNYSENKHEQKFQYDLKHLSSQSFENKQSEQSHNMNSKVYQILLKSSEKHFSSNS